jgi:hypothetical protein
MSRQFVGLTPVLFPACLGGVVGSIRPGLVFGWTVGVEVLGAGVTGFGPA